MQKNILDSELILNPDGSIYHLHLKPEDLADTVFLVGDPDRVKLISRKFDEMEVQVRNREFATHTGYYYGTRISVVSTGIGTDNIDIVLSELDALANIDFQTRTEKKEKRKLKFIRLGTSGALQQEIVPGSFVFSQIAGGLDGLIHFYQDGIKVSDPILTRQFMELTGWDQRRPEPYFVEASRPLSELLMRGGIFSGITLSAPGFYGPQGRSLRLQAIDPKINEKILNFRYNELQITNYEMESSALYGLSRMLGHEAVTLCVAIANRVTGQFIKDYKPAIKQLIYYALNAVSGKE
ncbi:MAG: nucleoside phosphorylase [Bacteroidota bacterium]